MVSSESFNGQRNPMSALQGRTANAPNTGGALSTTRTDGPQAPQAPKAEPNKPSNQFDTKEQPSASKSPNQPARQAASRSYRGQEKTEINIDARALRQKALQQKAAQENKQGPTQAPGLPDFPPPPPMPTQQPAQTAPLAAKAETQNKHAEPSEFPAPPKSAVPTEFPPAPPKATQSKEASSGRLETMASFATNKSTSAKQSTKVGKAGMLEKADEVKQRFLRGEVEIGEPLVGSHLLKPQSYEGYRTQRDKSDQPQRRMDAKTHLREMISERGLGLAQSKKMERQMTQLFALLT